IGRGVLSWSNSASLAYRRTGVLVRLEHVVCLSRLEAHLEGITATGAVEQRVGARGRVDLEHTAVVERRPLTSTEPAIEDELAIGVEGDSDILDRPDLDTRDICAGAGVRRCRIGGLRLFLGNGRLGCRLLVRR